LTVELLKEILKWTKVTNIPQVKSLLESTLASSEQRIAYEASNGKNVREVADIAHVGKSTIGRWWAEWVKLGLAELRPAKGGDRAFRSFSLAEFGLEVPKPNQKTKHRNETGGRLAQDQTTVINVAQSNG
jgi:hypothetical protein